MRQNESDRSDPPVGVTTAPMDYFDVGVRLRLLREARGLSQRELARRAGMTNANISQIEHGKISPSIQTLERVLQAFPVGLTEFFSTHWPLGEPLVRQRQHTSWSCGDLKIRGFQTSLYDANAIVFGDVELPPDGEGKLDWLSGNSLVLGVVHRGSLTMTLNSESHGLAVGDGFRFPAKQNHVFSNNSADSAHFTVAIHRRLS